MKFRLNVEYSWHSHDSETAFVLVRPLLSPFYFVADGWYTKVQTRSRRSFLVEFLRKVDVGHVRAMFDALKSDDLTRPLTLVARLLSKSWRMMPIRRK